MTILEHTDATRGLGEDGHRPIVSLPRLSIQVFCETQEVADVVEEAAKDRRMIKTHVKIAMGGILAAIETYQQVPTPNVLVVESSAQANELLAQLEKLAGECDHDTKVIVVGTLNDISLYRELMGRGVSDYLVTPFKVLDFVQSLSQIFSSTTKGALGHVISVFGAKGGVGASTIAHNLAWTISSKLDLSTAIVDMDLGFGTAGLNFNQDPVQGVAEAVFAPERVDVAFLDRLLTKCEEKLALLAAPASLERIYDFTENAFEPILDSLRKGIPAVVLDIPHIWSGWTRNVLLHSDEIVLVATPDLANLRNVKNVMDVFKIARPNDTDPKLILNMVGVPKRPEISVDDFSKAVGVEPIAILGFDPRLFGVTSNNGQMIAEVDSSHKILDSLNEVAHEVMRRSVVKREKRNFLEALFAKLRYS